MRKNLKILLSCIVILFLILATSPFTNAKFSGNLKSNRILDHPNRKILKPEDEGPHFHRLLPMREWWYYNVVFDKSNSELRNWSAMISFNYMSKSFEEPDIMFITLYDEGNKTYGGMVERERGALQAKGPGVNITFENSWVKGEYPNWYLHVEDEDADQEHEIILDFHFEAKSCPYWVMMNTGCGSSRSPLGYYSINHCDVRGNVIIDGEAYEIHGTGYHDHTWLLFMIGGASYFWDWFSVHFDNGLHAFIWQIIPVTIRNPTSRRPGFCWITDGCNFTEFKFFTMEYLEFENTSIPHLKRPKLFHISSKTYNSEINLYLETKNMHEYLWGKVPIIDVGLWEGSCSVNGTISMGADVLKVNGSAISEILRII